MESFFQRMSLIITRNSNKLFEQDIDEDENERQRQFNYLQGRRRSAPDTHRRGFTTDRLVRILDQKGTSDEQIATHFNTAIFPRKHYNSTGELLFVELNFYLEFKLYKVNEYDFF